MDKVINLNSTVYEICSQYPDMADVLYELGFKDIVKPGMLNTAGRFMPLIKGAAMKKIDTAFIKERLERAGYSVTE